MKWRYWKLAHSGTAPAFPPMTLDANLGGRSVLTVESLNTTFFSGADFVQALSNALGDDYRPLAVPVKGSGPPRVMYGIQQPARFLSRYVSLAPYGLQASPGWEQSLDPATVRGILSRLQGVRTRHLTWNVRFDHGALAACLESLGLRPEHSFTYVLHLGESHDRVFARYSASTRNHVRKSRRRGVVVRDAQVPEDVQTYYEIHMRLVRLKQERGRYGYVYPIALLLELARLRGMVRFLVAEWEGRIVGGGLFLRDGCSVRYFHGASDREYSHLYPLYAVLDEAVRWACDCGATFFNLTGAGGIATLEKFKSSWGTRCELEWTFEWSNPVWTRLSGLKETLVAVRGHVSLKERNATPDHLLRVGSSAEACT